MGYELVSFDGPGQNLILSDEPTVEKALDMVDCDFPKWAAGGTTKGGKSADVYRCGFGLRSYDRNIVKIHGLTEAPNSYMCPANFGGWCTTIYAGQDKQN